MTNGGQGVGRKPPILGKGRLAEIHFADCSIYRWTNRQMDGYIDSRERAG